MGLMGGQSLSGGIFITDSGVSVTATSLAASDGADSLGSEAGREF